MPENVTQPNRTSGSWRFQGSTGQGQAIPIGTLAQDLVHKFDAGADLPSAIEAMIIENLHVAFDTATKDFSFGCEGKLPFSIGSTQEELDVILNIELKRIGEDYQKSVSGVVLIGPPLNAPTSASDSNSDDSADGAAASEDTAPPKPVDQRLEFDLAFAADANQKEFIAAYQDRGGGTVSIATLIGAITSDAELRQLASSLDIELKDALFGVQSGTTAGPNSGGTPSSPSSRMIFAVDIGGGINLSNLPLVNKLFQSDQTLKLAFQPLFASQPFTTQELSALQGLLPNGSLPLPNKDIPKGLELSATLRIGDKPIQLALPLKLDQGKGEIAQDPAQTGAEGANLPTPAGATPADDGTKWIAVQKSFGPVQFNRIGVKYKGGDLWFMLDAGLQAAGLTLSMDGLGAGINISKLAKGEFDPSFALRGLGLDFAEGPLEIAGTFLREEITDKRSTPTTTFESYDGMLTVKAEVFSLTAIGGYARVQGHTSVFVYLIIDYPLGGPEFFFVNGLSGGFGYNRDFIAPPIDKVIDFPLVAEVIKPPGGEAGESGVDPAASSGQNRFDTLSREMKSLQRYVPPKVGQYFVAAGLRYTSFELLDSFTLLSVTFGKRLEIDILGITSAAIPTPESGGPQLAEIQMELKASFIPDEGLLEFRAQLTRNSYIINRACRLTGGFAFLAWFSGSHEGDFVLTLGGYHKQYVVPANYPRVPALGFNWHLSDVLSIKGDAYFALTPNALMAGGHLDANFHAGPVDAWIEIGADFLIAWKPFHYDARLYASIGARLTLDMGLFTVHVTVELGGDLHLWGPEFAGKVKIHYYVISVTVSFGDSSPTATPLTWEQFRGSFLPQPKPDGNSSSTDQVCSIVLENGLIKTMQHKDDQNKAKEYWVVNPKDVSLVTNATIPTTKASPREHYEAGSPSSAATISDFTIGPMGLKKGQIISEQTIEVTGPDGNDAFAFEPIRKSVPAGLWEELPDDTMKPDLNGKRLINDALTGFRMTPAKEPTPGITQDIPQQKLQYSTTTIENAYRFEPMPALTAEVGTRKAINNSLGTKSTADKRNKLLKALGFVQPEAMTSVSEHLSYEFVETPTIVK